MDPLDEALRALVLRQRIARLIGLGFAEHPDPERLVHLLRCGAERSIDPIDRDRFEIAYEITPRSPATAHARAKAWRAPVPEPEEWPTIGERMTLIRFDRDPPTP
jgi:hypothetical protein